MSACLHNTGLTDGSDSHGITIGQKSSPIGVLLSFHCLNTWNMNFNSTSLYVFLYFLSLK